MRLRAGLGIVGVAVVALVTAAPASAAQSLGERITGYRVEIEIQASGTLRVTETIDYDFGAQERHGIFRNIPVRFHHDDTFDRIYPIDDIDVSGDRGTPTDKDVSDSGGTKTIKIGDPDKTISGRHRYVISYDVRGAINRFDTHDELYWNAIGAEWGVPISPATVTVTSPGALGKVACFAGPDGSALPCDGARQGGRTATFEQRSLPPYAGITVVVALLPGAVADPGPILDERFAFHRAFARTRTSVGLFVALLALLAGGVARLVWRTGRDRRFVGEIPGLLPPEGVRGVEEIRPLFVDAAGPVQFTPADGMRPALMGVLVDERADPLDVTATIVDLAVRRHLRIDELPRKWFFSRQDWRLTQLATPPDDSLCTWEQTLLDALFKGREVIDVSDLKNTFHTHLKKIQGQLYADVMAHKWFTRQPEKERGRWFAIGVVATVVGVSVTAALATFTHLAIAGLPLVLAGLLLLALHRRMPRRTGKGSAALAQALGFQRYLHTAESLQLQFEEGAGIFARYLPYAVVLGETKRWAKAFAGLGAQPGDQMYWYGGPDGFDATHFSDSISAFSTSTAGTVASTPSSSGSSGFSGGSSGGGGGGGGGGSW